MRKRLGEYEQAVLERICSTCVERRDDGSCGVDPALECAVKLHLPRILEALEATHSSEIGAYVERIRQNICTVCEAGGPDACEPRRAVECVLDRYLPLVVEAIEDLRRREDGGRMAAAP